ncbi:uncharacterized protein LOC124914599 [Impatiens glandulifera]|uniref:uncharacterized protein LOC124914599 n=1 Tax=Impatiens glandulifera TaxID=253017 RepID=UPI001FB12CF9|nr:uncharacterized protein LOC124914599 [Impatiens glandulifera]XP_047311140.1 uncharacterized protein LOC124914599 [Impatiens glandulifera]XP_047311141.1 uncharacterized protein LOC124914599 [Impatiens glandulifera]XP_047311142.1 uncharacterized protein LOC124914599 [Impatiens glandulifera]XP_047311143.1 uncharacterized protein LOC124914599 [Impatiens glandulifera]XP_047311144.1 uncharacterized protein LOC124914599 [Impatiens glandulifera]
MSTSAVSMDIHHYGVLIDDKKRQVQCNFCGKIVSCFSRLKFHLAGIRGDVAPCQEVPPEVRELLRTELLEKKNSRLTKEVENLKRANIPRKRQLHLQSNDIEIETIDIQDVGFGDHKRVKDDRSTNSVTLIQRSTYVHAGGECSSPVQPLEEEVTQKIISKFFYESGTDTSPAFSYSFQKMLNSLGCGQMGNPNLIIPCDSDLKGRFLQDEVKHMQQYVQKIRDSWASTGCSILLDGWIDEDGRNLVNIIVECPQGPVYLQSADISATTSSDNALELCLDDVIADVGLENVVQILTYTVSARMEAVGKQLMEKYRSIFWTVSASHCIELVLEKMLQIDMINTTLVKAKTITKFIYSRAAIVELMRTHTWGRNLIKPSLNKSAISFLTLENIVLEEESLKNMFTSLEWTNSEWALSTEGREVADLVADQSFWEDAWVVSRGTIPMVRVLQLINENDKIKMGTIYETMDQVKETIKKELNGRESLYVLLWNVIDEIWNGHLHSPLHAAGYFLNPCLIYSTDFFSDAEVVGGLMRCIMRMTKAQSFEDIVSRQIEEYQEAKGAFGEGSSSHNLLNVCPASWWTTYGGGCTDLQKLAVRILSQTCSGGSKYQLKRTLAEKMLTKGRNFSQQQLIDMTFVHYNMHLQNVTSGLGISTLAEELDVQNDWISQPGC